MNHERPTRGVCAAMFFLMLEGCPETPVGKAATAGESRPEVVAPAAPVDAKPIVAAPGTGRDEYDSLSIGCERAIASRQEDGRTIVYITPTENGRVRPGQWVHCEKKDRPPSPACEVLAIVDGGMLEARCGEVKPGSPRPPK